MLGYINLYFLKEMQNNVFSSEHYKDFSHEEERMENIFNLCWIKLPDLLMLPQLFGHISGDAKYFLSNNKGFCCRFFSYGINIQAL